MAWDQTIDISSVLKLLKKPLMDEHKKKEEENRRRQWGSDK